MIALLDYGSGNLRSVEKALQKVGADVRRFTGPDGLNEAHGVVLPGVGAFDDCIQALKQQGLWDAVLEAVGSGKPFLGICVGYQALFERSEEFQSQAKGLALFPGAVVRFPDQAGLKVPQIGWNQVRFTGQPCPLFQGIPDNSFFYFVHSYYPRPEEDRIVAGRTEYGVPFASAVWQGNVFATQFHPEKSQKMGLRLLANFKELANPAI